jgi:anti-sigma regulatory factor (Ser/Thr protein kinase)
MTVKAVTYTARKWAMTSMPQAGVAYRTRAATRRSSLELAVTPSAVRTARHWAATVLAGSNPPETELIDSVVLLVSELVTNAIQAASVMRKSAKPRVWLAIAGSCEVVRIEVHDSAEVSVPETCHRDDDEESGRGLEVITALATTWGWQPEPCGKYVWCELAVSDL